MNRYRVCASCVLSAKDLKLPAETDVTKVVSKFVAAAEGVIAHWVQYARGVLLFIVVPGDKRSGAFYIYDRKLGTFWLLEPADGIFGGYSIGEMHQKIRQFRLLDFAENPARLIPNRNNLRPDYQQQFIPPSDGNCHFMVQVTRRGRNASRDRRPCANGR